MILLYDTYEVCVNTNTERDLELVDDGEQLDPCISDTFQYTSWAEVLVDHISGPLSWAVLGWIVPSDDQFP